MEKWEVYLNTGEDSYRVFLVTNKHVLEASNKPKEKALAQLPENQRRLLSVINDFG